MIENKTENNMSSSCLTRRSRNKDLRADWIPDQVGDDRRVESGRSMVEMLGTLAIIGVLSVGSIAGYRYAMDNYYTNEILAGASQRAVLVAAQIASGREASLKEFDKIETAGGEFDGTIKEWDGEFGIQVTKVKESVCENLIKATEDTDIILAKTDDSDLTESDCSGDNNTFLFVYSNDMGDTPDTACLNVECPEGSTCSRGSCLCPDGMLPCKGACCGEGEGEICSAPGTGDSSTMGECVTPTGECVTNADCDPGEFCLFESSTSDTDAGTTCYVPANGVCTPLTGSYAKKVVENTENPLYGVTYIDTTMNWWSASNWCQANKSSLMSLATLNTLSGLSASAMNETDSKTARKTALQGGLGKTGGLVWLEDALSSTSCNARSGAFVNGAVYSNTRNTRLSVSLCW